VGPQSAFPPWRAEALSCVSAEEPGPLQERSTPAVPPQAAGEAIDHPPEHGFEQVWGFTHSLAKLKSSNLQLQDNPRPPSCAPTAASSFCSKVARSVFAPELAGAGAALAVRRHGRIRPKRRFCFTAFPVDLLEPWRPTTAGRSVRRSRERNPGSRIVANRRAAH